MRTRPLATLSIVALLLCALLAPAAAQQKKPKGKVQVNSSWDVEAKEYYGTPASEEAVRKGLAWLSTRQSPDGHWASGGYQNDIGITGLCILSYLAAGHQPGRGRYGLTLNEAADFLVNSAHLDGNYGAPGLIRAAGQSGPAMYGHGFATLSLAEIYGMTRRKDVKRKLEAAVQLIENTQNQNGDPRTDGGWRYEPRIGDADLSVTVVQLLALRAARNAGLRVTQSVIDRAVAYIKRCNNPRDGGFNYQVTSRQSGPARTGGALLSLFMAGEGKSPECQNGLAYLTANPLNRLNEYAYREHYYYALYYITQAMYQAGGAYWRDWYIPIRERLVKAQDPQGSWSLRDGTSEAGGSYATAMAVLTLQVPAGLLPIYQK